MSLNLFSYVVIFKWKTANLSVQNTHATFIHEIKIWRLPAKQYNR